MGKARGSGACVGVDGVLAPVGDDVDGSLGPFVFLILHYITTCVSSC